MKGITYVYQPIGQDNYFLPNLSWALENTYPFRKKVKVRQKKDFPAEAAYKLFNQQFFDIYFEKRNENSIKSVSK